MRLLYRQKYSSLILFFCEKLMTNHTTGGRRLARSINFVGKNTDYNIGRKIRKRNGKSG